MKCVSLPTPAAVLWIELAVSFTESVVRIEGIPKGRWGICVS
jgi:hypothetical protein